MLHYQLKEDTETHSKTSTSPSNPQSEPDRLR